MLRLFITKLPKVILLCVIIYLISLNFKAVKEVPKNQEVKAEVSNVVPAGCGEEIHFDLYEC